MRCDTLAASRASSRNMATTSFSAARCAWMRLIATRRANPPGPERLAMQTLPMPPSPSVATSSYGPSVLFPEGARRAGRYTKWFVAAAIAGLRSVSCSIGMRERQGTPGRPRPATHLAAQTDRLAIGPRHASRGRGVARPSLTENQSAGPALPGGSRARTYVRTRTQVRALGRRAKASRGSSPASARSPLAPCGPGGRRRLDGDAVAYGTPR